MRHSPQALPAIATASSAPTPMTICSVSSPSHPTSAHTQIHARRCSVRPSSSAHYSTSFSLFLEPARVPASAESALDVPDAPRTSGCALQITSMVPTARSVLCSQNGQGQRPHSADYATHKAFSCPGGHIDPIVLKLSLSDAAVYPRLTIHTVLPAAERLRLHCSIHPRALTRSHSSRATSQRSRLSGRPRRRPPLPIRLAPRQC